MYCLFIEYLVAMMMVLEQHLGLVAMMVRSEQHLDFTVSDEVC